LFLLGEDEDERILLEIDADKETVERLLNEYRSSDEEGYNTFDFMVFLEEKGLNAREPSPDHYIYF